MCYVKCEICGSHFKEGRHLNFLLRVRFLDFKSPTSMAESAQGQVCIECAMHYNDNIIYYLYNKGYQCGTIN